MAFVNVVNNIFSQFLLPTVYKQKYSHESSFKRAATSIYRLHILSILRFSYKETFSPKQMYIQHVNPGSVRSP